jgi:hypothetical protein
VSATAFGLPVVPDVKSQSASWSGSSGAVAQGGEPVGVGRGEDDRLRFGEAEDVLELAGDVAGVQRHVDRAEQVGGVVGGLRLDPAVVVEQDPDPVAGADTGVAEDARHPQRALAQLGVGDRRLGLAGRVGGEQAWGDQRGGVAAEGDPRGEQLGDRQLRPRRVRPPEGARGRRAHRQAQSGYPTATPSSTRSMYSMIP